MHICPILVSKIIVSFYLVGFVCFIFPAFSVAIPMTHMLGTQYWITVLECYLFMPFRKNALNWHTATAMSYINWDNFIRHYWSLCCKCFILCVTKRAYTCLLTRQPSCGPICPLLIDHKVSSNWQFNSIGLLLLMLLPFVTAFILLCHYEHVNMTLYLQQWVLLCHVEC